MRAFSSSRWRFSSFAALLLSAGPLFVALALLFEALLLLAGLLLGLGGALLGFVLELGVDALDQGSFSIKDAIDFLGDPLFSKRGKVRLDPLAFGRPSFFVE